MKEKNRNFFKPLRFVFALIFAILVGFTTNVTAQGSGITISGVVNDASDGKSIPGASVYVEGTNEGTITNVNGEFSLDVPDADATIVVSFVGYKNYKFTPGDQREFVIEMESETQQLDDVVVIGYGTAKKSDLTGSVGVVESDDLNQTPNSDFTQALQGRASGVTVTQSGTPGDNAQVRIRGVGSINRDSSPIYVIDGVITDNLNSVSPTDIESIQVLKDASAAAIYGADGANGVIIVETKRGESGPPKVSYSGYSRVNRVPKQFDMMNADQYTNFYKEVYSGNGIEVPTAYTDDFRQAYYGNGWQEGTIWQEEIVRTGLAHNHNLRISGGGEGSNYSFSANYSDEKGILIGSSAEKFNLRVNSDFDLGEFIKVGESISFTSTGKTETGSNEGNPWSLAVRSSPLMHPYNEDNDGGFSGPYDQFVFEEEPSRIAGANDKGNPLPPMELWDLSEYRNNLRANVYVEIQPFPWLTFKTNPSIVYNFNRDKKWKPSYAAPPRDWPQSVLNEMFSEGVNLTMENQVTFKETFGPHNVTATGVHTFRDNETNKITGDAKGFIRDYLNTFSGSVEENRQLGGTYSPFKSESYLGRLMYDYNSKYLLTASIRKDGNSRFAPEKRWGSFPSLSLAWKVNEDFLQGVDAISLLKLRAGWGRTGNSDIGLFNYQSNLTSSTEFSPVFGKTNEQQKLAPAMNVLASFGNPGIKWESAEMLNFGVDLNLFNNQVQFGAEYYIKDQLDQLVKMPMSDSYGRLDVAEPWVNLGEVQNRGFEFTGIYKKRKGEFNHTVTANLTTTKNEVIKLPEQILKGNNITQEGHTIGSYYGYVAEGIITPDDYENGEVVYVPDEEGVESVEFIHEGYKNAMPTEGEPSPGDLKFKDLNHDGTISEKDRTIIGKPIPDFNYSLNYKAAYKGWDFSVFFYGMQNFDVFNQLRSDMESVTATDKDNNKLVDYANNYYRLDRPSTEYVRPSSTNRNERISTWFLEDASFIRLKDIQLGYSLSENATNWIGLASVRLYVNASNLVTITNYSGRDPEAPIVSDSAVEVGNDNGTYPVPRAFTAGLQIDF